MHLRWNYQSPVHALPKTKLYPNRRRRQLPSSQVPTYHRRDLTYVHAQPCAACEDRLTLLGGSTEQPEPFVSNESEFIYIIIYACACVRACVFGRTRVREIKKVRRITYSPTGKKNNRLLPRDSSPGKNEGQKTEDKRQGE